MKGGKSFGLHFHLLQRAVRSWPNVVAPKHVLENVSASDMVSLAQVYVVVSAWLFMFSGIDIYTIGTSTCQ